MKLYLTCILILLIIISVSLMGRNMLLKATELTANALQLAVAAYETGDDHACKYYLDHAEQIWQDHEVALSAFLSHGNIEDVAVNLAALPLHAGAEDREELFHMIWVVFLQLEHIRESQEFSLKNIF